MNDDGSPIRIDHSFSWEAPLGLHGMMHTVIGNAAKGDPYKIDVLFMFMANMAWNSAMNPLETIECLTAKDEAGEYVIPTVIYSDAFFSETVPYADLILPDTTYLERWDCISLLDRPISEADGPADSIRQPVVERTNYVLDLNSGPGGISLPDFGKFTSHEVVTEIAAHLGAPMDVPGLRRWLSDHFPRFAKALDAVSLARREQMFAGIDAKFGKAGFDRVHGIILWLGVACYRASAC